MTLNKRNLRKWSEGMRVLFTKEQERRILERFGEEPWPYEWSEQDIAMQIENLLGWDEFEKPMEDNGGHKTTCFYDFDGVDF